jgi:hypothetical protein
MRGHDPLLVEVFNGLWKRGDADSTPVDHFAEAVNIQYIESGFETRDGIQPFMNPRPTGTRDIARMYTFNTTTDDGLITLDSSGNFYHVIPADPSSTLILSVANAEDFAMAIMNDRAYITPFNDTGLNDFVYVYNGDGTPARKIAGDPPVDADGAMAAANSGTTGNVEAGIHIFGVVYETDSGFDTQIGPDTLPTVTATGTKKVDLSAIPVSPSSAVVARRIVATKAIDPAFYTGNTRGYEFFFVPDGEINDNVTTTLAVNFYDIELLEAATPLLELMSEVISGSALTFYHNRLVLMNPYGEPGLVRVSLPGEYEAFNEVDGIILAQFDGLGITTGQEYRDILYLFKINETLAATDNGDVPSSWPLVIIDEGLGAGIHGVCYIDTRQGMSSEFLLLENYSGIFQFDGTFKRPELSFKIKDLWLSFTQNTVARKIEFYNDVLRQMIFLNIPDDMMILMGDYANGMTPETIRWAKWTYEVEPNTITLFDKDEQLLIGTTDNI